MYHKTLAECLRRIKVRASTYRRFDPFSRNSCMYIDLLQVLKDCGDDARKIGIMVASHNEDTVRFAIENMKTIGISPEDKVICFGQLLGMCDYITFPLGMLNVNAIIVVTPNRVYSFRLQVRQATRRTSIFRTVQSRKCSPICRVVPRRIRVFSRRSRRRSVCFSARLDVVHSAENCSTRLGANMCLSK